MSDSAHQSERRLQLSEAMVGGVIAVIVELGNLAIFHHSEIGIALAIGTAILGVLLAVMRHSMEHYFSNTYQRVNALANIVDLASTIKLDEVASLYREYVNIPEEEFRLVKERIIYDAGKKLHDLSANKRSSMLPRNEYYAWLFRIINKLGAGSRIQAVSTSSDAEWDDSPEEKQFLEANLRAARAGCRVERIFVVRRANFANFAKNPAIVAHSQENGELLFGYVAFLDELERKASQLVKRLGSGFLLIDGRVVLLDDFSAGGDVRGVVTMYPVDVSDYETMFNEFKHMSERLSIPGVSRRANEADAAVPQWPAIG